MEARELLFSDYLAETSEKYRGLPAITCEGKTLTFEELAQASNLCSAALIKAGVKKGDRVALWGFNSIPWVISFLGIVNAGGVAVLMNYGLKAADTVALLKSVGASWMIVGPNVITMTDITGAMAVAREAGISRDHIFQDAMLATLGSSEEEIPDPLQVKEVLAQVKSQMDPHDTQVIIFTTGTTSFPKAPQLSSYSILNDAAGAAQIMFPGDDRIEDNSCLALPLFHSYGLTVLFALTGRGSHVFLPMVLKPDQITDLICDNQIGIMASVGAIYSMMAMHPQFDEKVAGRMKYCIVGGGFETPVKMMRLENAYGGAKIINGYGQTECSPIISVASGDDPLELRAVSVGRILPGLDVRIWRKDKGFVPVGEVGEVVVKGYNTMNGYLGLPKEQQAFDEDGWLHTGDLGRLDENNMLYLTGRIKDIIIRSGENISPSDVEKAVLEIPGVREVKVLGAPHRLWGESVEACVVLRDKVLFNVEEVRRMLKAKLSSFKVPSHFFVYPSFPLNENGKLDQRTLKADMLTKLLSINIREEVDSGMKIMSLTLKNQKYSINPACSMTAGLAENLGFGLRQRNRIRLSVEEMMTERVTNAYTESGEITLDVILMPHWLRLRFTDKGKLYRLEDTQNSLSAKIILANVDAYMTQMTADGAAEYCLDYQYEDDFDVNSYLVKNSKL